jgi:hypothetical protein
MTDTLSEERIPDYAYEQPLKPAFPPHFIGSSLRLLQRSQAAWSSYNFGHRQSHSFLTLLGAIEELGELAASMPLSDVEDYSHADPKFDHYHNWSVDKNDAIDYDQPINYLGTDVVRIVYLAEYLGKAAHAVLKRRQGIRSNEDHHENELMARDNLADIARNLDPGAIFYSDTGEDDGMRSESEAKDAVGDVVIYLMDLCTRRGWDFQRIVEQTCEQVFERDWVQYPENGRTA